MDDAVLIDGQLALHGQGIVLFGHKVLKVFAVLDGAADMQVDQIHVVHGGGVDLAVQAEGFGQMGNLQCAGDAVLPADIRADDVGGVLGDDLRHAPVATAGGLGSLAMMLNYFLAFQRTHHLLLQSFAAYNQ